jgi:hypothetical protein
VGSLAGGQAYPNFGFVAVQVRNVVQNAVEIRDCYVYGLVFEPERDERR